LKTLGERIRELREEKDVSVRELAKRLGVSAPFLSDVELGRRHPSDEVFVTIARALGVTVADLRSHDTRPPAQEFKRLAATNPAYGIMLRKVLDKNVDPEDVIKYLDRRKQRS
jgi:transcriptional regulator with XRE-family HTH domain